MWLEINMLPALMDTLFRSTSLPILYDLIRNRLNKLLPIGWKNISRRLKAHVRIITMSLHATFFPLKMLTYSASSSRISCSSLMIIPCFPFSWSSWIKFMVAEWRVKTPLITWRSVNMPNSFRCKNSKHESQPMTVFNPDCSKNSNSRNIEFSFSYHATPPNCQVPWYRRYYDFEQEKFPRNESHTFTYRSARRVVADGFSGMWPVFSNLRQIWSFSWMCLTNL